MEFGARKGDVCQVGLYSNETILFSISQLWKLYSKTRSILILLSWFKASLIKIVESRL